MTEETYLRVPTPEKLLDQRITKLRTRLIKEALLRIPYPSDHFISLLNDVILKRLKEEFEASSFKFDYTEMSSQLTKITLTPIMEGGSNESERVSIEQANRPC